MIESARSLSFWHTVHLTNSTVECRLDFQTLDHLTRNDMRIDDLVDIMFVDIGVPDRFGVDHHHRTFLTAIQATGLVYAHFALAVHIERLDATLGVFLSALGAAFSAACPTIIAHVGTDEHMVLVERIAHDKDEN